MMVVAIVLKRRGAPPSVTVWMTLGYLVGLFSGHRDAGGLIGSAVGILLGLASARIASRKG
jgi:hypothetical protein